MTRGFYSIDDVFDFGKKCYQSVEDVLEEDPDYIIWLIDNDICEFDDEVIDNIEKYQDKK